MTELRGCHDERRLECAVDVDGREVVLRMREHLHGADDLGHPLDAILGTDERTIDAGREVRPAGVALRLEHPIEERGRDLARDRGGVDLREAIDEHADALEALLQQVHVVADELHRRIELVGDAGRELAERLELLRAPARLLLAMSIAQIEAHAHRVKARAPERHEHRDLRALPIAPDRLALVELGRRRRGKRRPHQVDPRAIELGALSA